MMTDTPGSGSWSDFPVTRPEILANCAWSSAYNRINAATRRIFRIPENDFCIFKATKVIKDLNCEFRRRTEISNCADALARRGFRAGPAAGELLRRSRKYFQEKESQPGKNSRH